MIAIDDLPITLVEDVSFINLIKTLQLLYQILSQIYIRNTIFPQLHTNIYDQLNAMIASESHLSITSDIQTSSCNNSAFLRLSAHWISSKYERMNANLCVQHFEQNHTGDEIGNTIEDMMI